MDPVVKQKPNTFIGLRRCNGFILLFFSTIDCT